MLIRARAVFLACKFGEKQARRKRFWHTRKEVTDPPRARQLFSEELIAEDVDLGSRVHALGFKSVYLDEILARGEVPPPPPLGPHWLDRLITSFPAAMTSTPGGA